MSSTETCKSYVIASWWQVWAVISSTTNFANMVPQTLIKNSLGSNTTLFCSTGPESLPNACFVTRMPWPGVTGKRQEIWRATLTRQNTGWKKRNGSFWFLKVYNPFYTLRAINNIGLFFLSNFLLTVSVKGRLTFLFPHRSRCKQGLISWENRFWKRWKLVLMLTQ